MPFKKTLIILSAIVVSSTYAIAQDPIAQRQSSMKEVGGAARTVSQMLRGQADFDAAAALAALEKMNEVAKVYGTLFPEGSETGGDTKAAAAIWEDMDGFQAAVAKFETDTAAAISAAPADLEALQVAFEPVGANCGTCHRAYRNR